jgi:hypothetical protein
MTMHDEDVVMAVPRRGPFGVIAWLDGFGPRRIWGRWPGVRVVLAYSIWFVRYRHG